MRAPVNRSDASPPRFSGLTVIPYQIEDLLPTYIVHGPFKIPTYEGKAAKIITAENIKEFWSDYEAMARGRGCYLFAIRAGGGVTPYYVGRATRDFKREVFASHKLAKYQQSLADYRKGTPVLYFIAAPPSKGAPNVSVIAEMEEYLIQTAVSQNADLLNVKGTKKERFAIAGVLRSGVGKPSKAARSLKACLGL